MRKHLMQDYHHIYYLNLGRNIRRRESGKTISNVFDIIVGVGITIAIRSKAHNDPKLSYCAVTNTWRKEEKLAFLTWNVTEDGV